MRRQFAEHLFAVVLVGLVFIVLIQHFQSVPKATFQADPRLESFLELQFLDLDNSLHRSMLAEAMQTFEPATDEQQLLSDIDAYRSAQITAATRQVRTGEGLSTKRWGELLGMYWQFILVYVLVMLLTYYGVQTLGVYRFVRLKHGNDSFLLRLKNFVSSTKRPESGKQFWEQLTTVAVLLAKAAGRGALYLLLFSPAYVIAYSIKPSFNTDSLLFMVILGVLSNGLLITYAHKFYSFLVGEGHKGYVNTALVKGLNSSYKLNTKDGIQLRQILALRKSFNGHVLQHIFINARYQYLSTLKEQASFVITGLVIIEMALNIQGHLCYELLQNILFKQYDVLFAILLGIFLVVKTTDIFADIWYGAETRRYDNR